MKQNYFSNFRVRYICYLFLLSLFPLLSLNAQQTHYVNINATGASNGTSFIDAYVDLQTALDIAVADDEIRVAQGTYLPTDNPDGTTTDARKRAFHFDKDLIIKGGYNAITGIQDLSVPSVLSGDFNGDDATTGNSENALHVFIIANLSDVAVLDNFEISGGNANNTSAAILYSSSGFESFLGGGLFNFSSNLQLTNMIFKDNSSKNAGGGLFNRSASPSISDAIFNNNVSANGAGMYEESASSSTLSQVLFEGNNASNDGGGAFIEFSTPSFNQVVFKNNTADAGGGVANQDNADAEFINVFFIGNTAAKGGGMFSESSEPTLTNVVFYQNLASSKGAGMFNSESAHATLVNVTFVGNSGATSGGMLNETTSNPILYNTVFYDNDSNSAPTSIEGNAVDPLSSYNASDVDLGGLGAGTGYIMLSTDPFTNSTDADGADNIFGNIDDGLIPLSCGVLLNAGANSQNTEMIDIASQNRIFDMSIDIGAYENQFPNMVTTLFVDAFRPDNSGNGLSFATAFKDLQYAMDGACEGSEIRVAQGTYLPTESPDGTTTDLRNRAFHFDKDLIIKGGFDATSGIQDLNTPSILSGDFNNDDVVSGSGSTLNITGNTGNAYRVFLTVNLSDTSLIEGFSILGGNADNASSIQYSGQSISQNIGGGMYNNTSSPTINKVIFSRNSAESGGGMFIVFSSSILTNVVFAENIALNGGGLNNTFSTPNLTNALFSGNDASQGGGMLNISSSPIINNATFSGNYADIGGGLENTSATSSPELYNTVFYGNTAGMTGSDIIGDINASSSNNASDGTGGNISAGADFITLISDPFEDSTDPDGADNIYGTTDDGLIPNCTLANLGLNSANSESNDITGQDRKRRTIDIGAYENQNVPINIYVDSSRPDNSGDGLTFPTAYRDLQFAIDIACTGANIIMAEGIYLPTDAPDDSTADSRDRAFHINKDIRISGSYNAITGFPDYQANTTILSGDFNGDDLVTGSGNTLAFSGNTENAYHVFIAANITRDTELEGLSIQGGHANGAVNKTYFGLTYFSGYGAGIYLNNANPTLDNVNYTENFANRGGGMYNIESSPKIDDSEFTNNGTEDRGGGIFNVSNSSPRITDVIFEGNTAHRGGGMYNSSLCAPNLSNVSFTNNYIFDFASRGAGMYNFEALPTLTNVSFNNNIADDDSSRGAGMYNSDATVSLTNVSFNNNNATGTSSLGGAIYNSNTSITIINATFFENTANEGGAIYNSSSSSPIVFNSVFYGNMATTSGDAIFGDNVDASSDNNASDVLEGNIDAGASFIDLSASQSPFINSSLPEGADGIFNTEDDGLRPNCTLINLGDNSANTENDDIAGNDREVDSTIDIGAYENQSSTGTIYYVDASRPDNTGDGLSFATAYRDLQVAMDNVCADTEIRVAQGIYFPTESPDNVTLDGRNLAFHLSKDLTIKGGYDAATEVQDVLNPSVLNGDIGVLNDATDNSYHVLVTINLTNAAIIENFKIENGNANSVSSISYETEDILRGAGGGIYNTASSSPTITKCIIDANNAITAGGIYNTDGASPRVFDVSITNNTAANAGGMQNTNASLTLLTNVVFANNQVTIDGGGMLNNVGSLTTLNNVLFVNNGALNEGGGLYLSNNNSTLTSVTFTNNTASSGGGLYNSNATPLLHNTIFYGNIGTSSGADISGDNIDASSSHNASDGTGGNITSLGVFVDLSSASDPFLDSSNPAGLDGVYRTEDDGLFPSTVLIINAGNNSGNVNPVDIARQSRINETTIDIGAYESQSTFTVSGNGINIAFEDSTPSLTDDTSFGTIEAGNSISKTFTIENIGSLGLTLDGSAPDYVTVDNSDFSITSQPASTTVLGGASTTFTVTFTAQCFNEGENTATVSIANSDSDHDPFTFAIAATTSALTIPITLFVDASRPDNTGDGFSFATAYKDLQVAIDNACTGSEIRVAQGTYFPTESPDAISVDSRDFAFHLDKDMVIKGGYNTGSGIQDVNTPSILSGDFNNDDSVSGSGSTLAISNNDENAYHIIISFGLTNTALFEGFNIIGANANGGANITYNDMQYAPNNGAFYNIMSSPSLSYLSFEGNSSGLYGSAMYNNNSSPNISNSTFIKNTSAFGTVYNGDGAHPILTDVAFSENKSSFGAGIYTFIANFTITNASFNDNSSSIGGAIYTHTANETTLNNVKFIRNSASIGGSLYGLSSNLDLVNVVFSKNHASFQGGGMNMVSSNPTLTNVLFTENSSDAESGGLYLVTSHAVLRNVTFFKNTAEEGGALFNNVSTPTLYNTVFYENTATSSGGTIFGNNIAAASSNNASDFAEGNLDAGSNFVTLISNPFIGSNDPDGADDVFGTTDDGLIPNCFLNNLGDNSFNSELTDITGESRIFDTTIDIGAYENQSSDGIIYYVDASRPDNTGDGLSFATAFRDLQVAMDNVCADTEIHVAQGSYLPTESPDGIATDAKYFAFHLNKDLIIKGGYDTTTDTQDLDNPSILSGDFLEDDIVTGSGSTLGFSNNSENAYHVIVTANLSNNTLIEGFIIKGGNTASSPSIIYANQEIFSTAGGGMFNATSSPILTQLEFTENNANGSGGAINNDTSAPIITDVSFSRNNADVAGGAIYSFNSNSEMTGVNFTGNKCGLNGGGLYIIGSSPIMTDVLFEDNYAALFGGGIYNISSVNSVFNVLNSTFVNNNVGRSGGGIFSLSGNNDGVTNVSFINNSATENGAGIYLINSDITLTNNTFFGNSADILGGGLYIFNTTTTSIYNTVFYGNTSTNGISDIDAESAAITISNDSSYNVSDALGVDNSNNFTALFGDPFIDSSNPNGIDAIFGTTDDGLLPSECSVLLNAGDNTKNSTTTDIAGQDRIIDTTIDIGAYESLSDNQAPIVVCKNRTIQLDANGAASITIADINDGVSDNCTATADLVLALSQTNFTCSDLGDKIVTLTVTDTSGNTGSCDATVTVQDNIAPIVICQNITVELDTSGNASITAADINNGSSDNCTDDASLQFSLDITDFTQDDIGQNTVLLLVTDSSGNTATCSATVDVVINSENLKKEFFTIYPNPSSDYVIIKNNRNTFISSITIFDMTGKRVKNIEYNETQSEYMFSVLALRRAVYIIKMDTDDGLKKYKIIRK